MTFNFPGNELTVGDCEVLALSRVAPQYRQREADLFTRKWFDYRDLHPVKATYLFANYYQEVVKLFWAETRDKATAGAVKALRGDLFALSGTELSGCWRARQTFDAIGVRYDFALRFALKQSTERGWRMFPRPNQLYGEALLLDIRDAWAVECGASLQLPRNERFKVEHFTSHPDQLAFRSWLIGQIKARQQQHHALVRVINEGLLDMEVAKASFPGEVIAQAVKRLPVKVSHA